MAAMSFPCIGILVNPGNFLRIFLVIYFIGNSLGLCFNKFEMYFFLPNLFNMP